MDWEEIRNQYPAVQKHTYLNSASAGLISLDTKNILNDHLEDFLQNGGINRSQWVKAGKSAKVLASELLGCDVSELGFVPDVSSGMNLAAERMDQNLTVVLVKGDFPSVGLPWIARGYKVQWVDMEVDGTISLEKIKSSLIDKHKILAISWVQYSNGFTIDLKELSKIRNDTNATLVVDGTQGVGNIPINLKELSIDVFMASCFKWQTGGYGIAHYYENNQSEFKSNAKSIGWNSLKEFGPRLRAENFKNTTEVVEAGHPKYISLITLNAALSQLKTIGWTNIFERVSSLRFELNNLISSLSLRTKHFDHSGNQAPILSVLCEDKTYANLKSKGIIVTRREDYIRLSVHFYNNVSDLSKLEAALKPE